MTDRRFATKQYRESVWANITLPQIAIPPYDVRKILNDRLPKSNRFEFIEIGCAPGGWMAYFINKFNVHWKEIEASIRL